MSSLFHKWLGRTRDRAVEREQTAKRGQPAESTTVAGAGSASDAAEAAGATEAGVGGAARVSSDAAGGAASVSDAAGAGQTASTADDAAAYRVARPARSTKTPTADAQLAAAVDLARQAIAEVVGEEQIGEHLGIKAEGQRLVTHAFACTNPAYPGWRWVTVLARAPRAKKVTVCETALLPGEDALLAPAWVPWEERLEPGDLSARDTLPKVEEDPNLVYGFEQVDLTDDDAIDQIPNYEFGLGRKRVLSNYGLSKAAHRWEESEAGPEGDYARRASAHCVTCGYLMPLAGPLRTQFGVCANEWSPFDGRVVALDSGCGAHSETDVRRNPNPVAEAVVDDFDDDLDVVEG